MRGEEWRTQAFNKMSRWFYFKAKSIRCLAQLRHLSIVLLYSQKLSCSVEHISIHDDLYIYLNSIHKVA